MAQKVSVLLIDDLDGSEADETIEFGLDGTEYLIELSNPNADALRAVLAPYRAAARRVGRTGKVMARSADAPVRKPIFTTVGASNATIRAWAKSNGYPIKDRGGIPREVRAAFDRAN